MAKFMAFREVVMFFVYWKITVVIFQYSHNITASPSASKWGTYGFSHGYSGFSLVLYGKVMRAYLTTASLVT